jgi:hypothetical protein
MWGYWRLSMRAVLLGFVIPVSVGFTLALTGFFLTRNEANLAAHGDVVRARIRESENRGEQFWVAFEYLDERTALHRGEALLQGAAAEAARTSGFLEIRYDRRRPDLYDLATNGRQSFERSLRSGTLLLGCLVMLAAILTLIFRAIQIFRTTRLLKQGIAINSNVRAHALPGKPAGRGQFTFAYQGLSGRWHEGVSPVLPANYLKRFPVGKVIVVVYDRNEPKRSEVDLFGIRDGG